MRATGRLPLEASDHDMMSILGLQKCPHPVVLSGPILAAGIDISGLPWIGLPPDQVTRWRPAAEIRSLLSIENLTSFHQHIRQAMIPGDVVIYTGGFPSRGTADALRVVASWCPGRCFHWGDVDPSGVMIPLHIERVTGVAFRPHLMDAATAKRCGMPANSHTRIMGEGTAFSEIGAFLASPEAHHMEQEELDPAPVTW